MQESSEATAHLDELRAAGLRLAIDDFGTGYSNLTRLSRLQPSLLKTDRSLVRMAGTEAPGGPAFLNTACSLANSLGCDVVIEGIETEAEEAAARLTGVRYVQGFRYARPGPKQRWLQRTGPTMAESSAPTSAS